jgi:hypothetical protein
MVARLTGFVLLLSLAVYLSGCTTINHTVAPAAPRESLGTYQLQIPGMLGGNRVKTYPVEAGMTAQTVLESSGLMSRYHDFQIDIHRRIEGGPGMIKLPVHFDTDKNHIAYESDYAIHAGDRVVIQPRTFSAFEQITKTLGGSN